MYSAWAMAFVWLTMFTCVTGGQVILWGFRSMLPCSEREREIRLNLLRGTTLGLVIFLLGEAAMILAHIQGVISLEGVL
jgi:hypothetical protein